MVNIRNELGKLRNEVWHILQMDYSKRADFIPSILGRIDGILEAPKRNCDVGTAKEQFERFHKYCPIRFSADKSCRECPIMVEWMKKEECGKWDCGFEFLQMPYEEVK